jgi:hypothetical protein
LIEREETHVELELSNTTEAAQWLQSLYNEQGFLTAEMVRDAARSEDCPAHAFVFNLPEDEAAEQHYLERARKLIRSIRIVYRDVTDQEPTKVRFFHSVPTDDTTGHHYISASDLARKPDQMLLARNEAERQLRGAERAVEGLDLIANDPEITAITKPLLNEMRTAREAIAAVPGRSK